MKSLPGEPALRSELLKAGLTAYRLGLVADLEGNLSARVAKDSFLVSPHWMPYESRVPEDFILMGLGGKVIRGERAPSSEFKMHAAVYRSRPDVRGIVHAHPVYSSALAVVGEPIAPLLDEVIPFAGGPVGVAPFAPSGSAALARAAVRSLGKGKAVLLANHGSLCVGEDLADALRLTRHVEKWAEIAILVKLLGVSRAIPNRRQRLLLREVRSRGTAGRHA